MSAQLDGTLRRVDSVALGSPLAAAATAGQTTLQVENAARFGTAEAVTVAGAEHDLVDIDLDTDTLTITPALAADVAESTPVAALDATGEDMVEHWGTLEPDDPDLDAQPIAVLLTTGTVTQIGRSGDLAVRVRCDWVRGQWWATVVLDREPQVDAPTRVTDAAGSSVGGTSGEGDVQARDLDVVGLARMAGNSLIIDGQPFDELLLTLARGVWAWGEYTPAVIGITPSSYAIMLLPVYLPEPRRVALEVETELNFPTNNSGTRFDIRIRYTFNADTEPAEPTGTSDVLATYERASVVNQGNNAVYEGTLTRTLAAGYYLLRLELDPIPAGSTINTNGPTKLQVTDRGPANESDNQASKPTAPGVLAAGGSDGGAVVVPQTRQVTYTYHCIWSRSYRGNGAEITSNRTLYVGDSGNGHGIRDSAIGFNDAKIRNDLAGADVEKVEIFLFVIARPGGQKPGTVVLGYHGDSNPSGSWGGVGGKDPDRKRSGDWAEGRGRWVDITDAGVNGWKTGSRRGVILTAPNSQYEWAFAATGPNEERYTLRITAAR